MTPHSLELTVSAISVMAIAATGLRTMRLQRAGQREGAPPVIALCWAAAVVLLVAGLAGWF